MMVLPCEEVDVELFNSMRFSKVVNKKAIKP